jgi:hypothetical protein
MSLAVLAVAMFASVATTPATPRGSGSEPFSIELGPERPIVSLSVAATFDRDVDPDATSANLSMEFDQSLGGVRVSVITDPSTPVAYFSAGFPHILSLPEGCERGAPCQRDVTVIFELDPTVEPADRELTGRITWSLSGNLDPDDPDDLDLDPNVVTVSITDEPAPTQVVTSDSVSGGPVRLDAEHPMMVEHVRVRFDPASVPDAVGTVFGGRVGVSLADSDAEPPVSLRVHAIGVPSSGSGTSFLADGTRGISSAVRPIPGCPAAEGCTVSYEVVATWRGEPGTVADLEWEFEAWITDFGVDASGASVEVSHVDSWAVPPDAAVLKATGSGELEVRGPRSTAGLAETQLQISIDRAAIEHAIGHRSVIPGHTPVIPGIVVLTVEALERDGVAGSNPIDVSGGLHRGGRLVEVDVLTDGKLETGVMAPFRVCEDEAGCDVIVEILTAVFDDDVPIEYPVTVRWTLEVVLSSFDEGAFPPGAGVELIEDPEL